MIEELKWKIVFKFQSKIVTIKIDDKLDLNEKYLFLIQNYALAINL